MAMNNIGKLVAVLGLAALSLPAQAEWSGNIALELRGFTSSSLYPGQKDGGISLSFQPEYRHQWNDGNNGFTFIPFVRIDSMDEERTHLDIRELTFLWVKDSWEIRAGVSRVFWGVTESQHLVDIINQTDNVENIDGEDKLGQPMLRVTKVIENGALDFFVLPYFRERTFSGVNGRLRSPLVVDTDNPLYQSSDREKHVDWAVRWNQTVGNVDFALSWFQGTAREPMLLPNATGTALQPLYPQLKQAGLELQYTGEEWLWKLEAVHRKSLGQSWTAAVGGFEYTFVGIKDSAIDLGLIMEYHFDSRDLLSTSPFQNDLFIGGRLVFNDAESTEILAGGIFDLDYSSKTLRIEASRRFGDSYKVTLEAQAFVDVDPRDPLFFIRKDNFIQLEVAKYF